MEEVTVSEVAAEIILGWTQQGSTVASLREYVMTPADADFATQRLRFDRWSRSYFAHLLEVEGEVRRLAKWAVDVTKEAS